jgi:hypothetical protein
MSITLARRKSGQGATFTDEVLDDAMAAILRKKTPAERLAIAFRLWTFAQQMVRQTVRREHPDYDEAELRRQVARRMSHEAV